MTKVNLEMKYRIYLGLYGPNQVVSRDIPMNSDSETWEKLDYNDKNENMIK